VAVTKHGRVLPTPDDPRTERYKERLREVLSGQALALRWAQQYPLDGIQPRSTRAQRFMAASRVMKMGEWRPTFPYLAPRP
jgi:hypothetical protein